MQPIDSQGVLYQLTGMSHAARLITSIWTLRKVYDGPIHVCYTADCRQFIRRSLLGDSRLRCTVSRIAACPDAYNHHFITKSSTLLLSPYAHTVYFDADTLAIKPIDKLFNDDFVLVQPYNGICINDNHHFANPIRKRAGVVKRHSTFLRKYLTSYLSANPPAINAGVQTYITDHPIMKIRHFFALACKSLCLGDEAITNFCSLMMPPHTVLDNRWNCIPKRVAPTSDTCILHFTGASNYRKRRCSRIYEPYLQDAIEHNAADIASWISRPECQSFTMSISETRQRARERRAQRRRLSTDRQ